MTVDREALEASLRELGVPTDRLMSKPDQVYKFMVDFCRSTGELPTANDICEGVGIASGSLHHHIRVLEKENRIAKVNLGVYAPILPQS